MNRKGWIIVSMVMGASTIALIASILHRNSNYSYVRLEPSPEGVQNLELHAASKVLKETMLVSNLGKEAAVLVLLKSELGKIQIDVTDCSITKLYEHEQNGILAQVQCKRGNNAL